jgi:hypothetical protein
VLVGLVAALTASVLFNVGVVLQAIDARVSPRRLALRFGLLLRLVRRPVWLAGWLLGLIGIWPQIVAYAHAPFVVVQPALAAGLAPFAVRGSRFDSAMLTIVASGCAFAATNIATKLLGDDFNGGHYASAGAWAVVGLANGLSATITNMTAFQRRPATVVVPVSTAVQTFLPIVLEPFFLIEAWGSVDVDGLPLAAGLVLACAGTIAVSSSTAVSGFFASAAS